MYTLIAEVLCWKSLETCGLYAKLEKFTAHAAAKIDRRAAANTRTSAQGSNT